MPGNVSQVLELTKCRRTGGCGDGFLDMEPGTARGNSDKGQVRSGKRTAERLVLVAKMIGVWAFGSG